MTYAQWLWEYKALKEKEKCDVDTTIEFLKLFKVILIKLFGLDLLVEKRGDDVTSADSLFVPMALMMARREVADVILKKIEAESVIQKVMKDDEFEKMSAAIARGEYTGDMEPIINDEPNTINELIRVEELKSAGVNVVDNLKKNISHIQLNNDEAIQRSKDVVDELNSARRSVSRMIEEEKEIKPVNIKFDNNEDDNA